MNSRMPSAIDTSIAPQVTSCDAAEADRPAEKPGDRGGEQRQENDGDSHRGQPLIMWMSSTWIVPRLRK